ncbi:Lanosterol 14-alpha demethylase [Enhygromyxa salina]|uniref:Lanosterol 14-alpha demethylase n=1 Tax=Enhygromyxa salina TaxID=215803 RepID=A0A2S9XJX6_9BACT|nr:cytochrome P450 [Enhygromyxa salina]PRP93189.1 Lanosterol 14-alpha demethylase [Enhygromyxa salina]
MAWPAVLATCLAIPAAYLGSLRAFNGSRRRGEPPLLRGSLPFLGVALPFGRDAMGFLAQAREDHGDVFTLLVGGRRMTFVLDPMGVPEVLKAKPLSFEPIGDEVMASAFGLPEIRDLDGQEPLEKLARVYLKGQHLGPVTGRMEARLRRLLPELLGERRELELYRFIWELMFAAGTDALFGDALADPELARAFEDFDRDFPLMVAGMPDFMVKQGVVGREALVGRLGANIEAGAPELSEWMKRRREIIRACALEPEQIGCMQAAVLWAAHANTIPAAFWALVHLIHDREAGAAVRAELAACDTFDTEALDSLRLLDSAIREALRLSSGSLTVRRAMLDFELGTPSGSWALREGDRVCIAPYLSHRDPEIFEEPERYRHDRFYIERGVKQFFKGGERVPMPLMPFGAGVSMCPGRFFAINEVKLLVALMLSRFELELAAPGPLPGFDLSRAGLGIYPPSHDVVVRLAR